MMIEMEQALQALKAVYNTHYHALCEASVDGWIADSITDLQHHIRLLDEGDVDMSVNRLLCSELATPGGIG